MLFSTGSNIGQTLQSIIIEKQYNQINKLWWNKEKGSQLLQFSLNLLESLQVFLSRYEGVQDVWL